jgi:hypothetical protein
MERGGAVVSLTTFNKAAEVHITAPQIREDSI